MSMDLGYIICFNQNQEVSLPYLLSDISSCLTGYLRPVPLHYENLMSMLVRCVDTRLTFCLHERRPMTTKHFDSAINKVRYCGAYVSDLQDSTSNIQIHVIKGNAIVVDFLYFNFQWSHSVCSVQGVIVAGNVESRAVHCGKRLPWQYIHRQDTLYIEIYGLNSLIIPKYLDFFFGIEHHRKWRECCKRMSMPESLTLTNTLEASANDFYIVSALKYIISVEADTSNGPKVLMFDGPGKRSPVYQITSNVSILSSSSQIVISALNTSHIDDNVTFTYIHQFTTGRLQEHSCSHIIARTGVKFTKIHIQFGKENQSNYICHYMFLGSDGLFYRPYINITMFTFEGPTSHTETLVSACQYGGLYVHTKDSDDKLKLRMELCGNVGEPTPSLLSYKEMDLLLSIIWYRGYSTGSLVAEVQVITCYVVPLPCSIYIRREVELSEVSPCNIFYFIWLDDPKQRHYCMFRLVSYNSQIIGPTKLSVSTNVNSVPDQHMTTDHVVVFTRSFNDWPHWTVVNKHELNLNYSKAQNLQRDIRYLDTLTVRFRGMVQPNRLLKVQLKIAECLLRETSEKDFPVANNVIVHFLCGEIQTLRSDQSLFYIYAPYDDTERLAIYTLTSHLCHRPPPSTLYVIEQNKETRTQYNYTVKNSMNLQFKAKHTGSNFKFYVRYTEAYQNINKECELVLHVDIHYMDENLQRNRNELVQQSGRRLQFHEARFVKILLDWMLLLN